MFRAIKKRYLAALKMLSKLRKPGLDDLVLGDLVVEDENDLGLTITKFGPGGGQRFWMNAAREKALLRWLSTKYAGEDTRRLQANLERLQRNNARMFRRQAARELGLPLPPLEPEAPIWPRR